MAERKRIAMAKGGQPAIGDKKQIREIKRREREEIRYKSLPIVRDYPVNATEPSKEVRRYDHGLPVRIQL